MKREVLLSDQKENFKMLNLTRQTRFRKQKLKMRVYLMASRYSVLCVIKYAKIERDYLFILEFINQMPKIKIQSVKFVRYNIKLGYPYHRILVNIMQISFMSVMYA